MKPRNLGSPIALLALFCSVVLLLGAGCAAFQSYPAQLRYAESAFADGDYDEAVKALKKVALPEQNRLLFLLELGTFYHTQREYAKSNAALLEAVQILKEYDARARVSLRDSAAFAAALLVNDKMRPYRGSPFERVLLHTYLAMNFLMQRNLEDARVEVLQAYAQQKEAREEHEKSILETKREAEKRRLDTAQLMAKLQVAYADQRGPLEQAGNVYQNAFTYYLSSLIYEMHGEISEAYIDAKTVYSLNPNFLPVRRDLLRYSRQLGVADYEDWRRQFGPVLPDALPEGEGEIVLLFECGLAPVKEEIKLSFPVPVKDHWNIVTVAIPKYRTRNNPVKAARLFADGALLGVTQPLMNVEATAMQDLWDQALGIALRQLIRASGRVLASEEAKRKGGGLLFLGVVLAGYAMEQADLRSWISLPGNLQVLRTNVPAGCHRMEIELVAAGAGSRTSLGEVSVRAGAVTLINLRSTGVHGTATHVTY